MKIPDDVVAWLMDGPAWVRYRIALDMRQVGELDMDELWREVRNDPLIKKLLVEVGTWPWPKLTSHRSAAHPLHKLVFLADIGFGKKDAEMKPTMERLLEQRDPEGPFQIVANVSESYGGAGKDVRAWALCDSPSIAYALATMDMIDDPRVEDAVSYMLMLARTSGWPCAVSKEMGKFRGPGRKGDPCPYANLIMLKLLSLKPSWRDSQQARDGTEEALRLWSKSKEEHPYQFYMGNDFRKLKVPYVWYDVMHAAEVLSRYPRLRNDERLIEMASLIQSKMDREGRLTPESVWMDWKRWEFGQKDEPSRWLTFLAYRILDRMDL